MQKMLTGIMVLGIISLTVALGLNVRANTYAQTEGTRQIEEQKEKNAIKSQEMRALWVSTVYNLDYPNKGTTDSKQLKTQADKIIKDAADLGFNAIMLQVRPSADALYKSNIFPWSKYLTGKNGTAPDNNFDPLQYFIDESKKVGIEIHAWINPFRVTKKGGNEKDHDISQLAASHPAVKNPSYYVKHTDGNLYFNPAIPEVRKLIIDGALEIVEKYDVAGIHLDDYFYPSTTFDDAAEFKKYGAGLKNIDDFRRNNINILIKDLDTALHKADPTIEFGVSPFAIWANKSKNAEGSDTNSAQSYYEHYADTKKWVKDGIIDYIAPQIYWEIGNKSADYKTVLEWWNKVVDGTGVKLYIGHAAYKAVENSQGNVWNGSAEIKRQIDLNKTYKNVNGSIMFRYDHVVDNKAVYNYLKSEFNSAAPSGGTSGGDVVVVPDSPKIELKPVPAKGLMVGRPSGNITTDLTKYYITGKSDPSKPLYLNGKEITYRSPQGYFGTYQELKSGKNTFKFTQGDKAATISITRGGGSSSSGSGSSGTGNSNKLESAGIFSTLPSVDEYRKPGTTITLSCIAPIGAKLSVKINGNTYAMTPATTKKPSSSGIYGTKFSYKLTIPKYTGTPRAVSLGKPVYTMQYGGKTVTSTSKADLYAIMDNAPVVAEVTAPLADTYLKASSSQGSDGEVYMGMKDYITETTADYAKLSIGLWISRNKISISPNLEYKTEIKFNGYTTGEGYDTLAFGGQALVKPSFDGKVLKVDIPRVTNAQKITLPAGSPFGVTDVTLKLGVATYTLTLKEGSSINGYYIDPTENGFNIVVVHKKKINAASATPLQGLTIVVDAGHGGTDGGSVGALGSEYDEADVNLSSAVKVRDALEKLGAKVVMTRTSDIKISLSDRLDVSRDIRPDLFISMHANSMPHDSNISKIRGMSVFYRSGVSNVFSKEIFNGVKSSLGLSDKGLSAGNYYVLKGTWCPSIIFESGFMPNPYDFEWLISESAQNALADSIAKAVVKYFS